MKNNKGVYVLFIGLFIVAIFSLFSNFKNYKVYVKQDLILASIANGKYEFSDEYIERISSGYPNLTATVIPFNSIIGAHWINNDSLELGLDYLRKGNKENPYLGFSDMLLAYVYQNLKMKDSFEYYTKEANRKLPNSPIHFALLGNLLLSEEKLDSFNYRFKEITNRVPDREVWRVYLSTMAVRKYDFDTIEVNENAVKAKSIFPDNKSINLTADYVLYGAKNVKKSIELRKTAIDSFPNNPTFSIKNINKAIALVPDNRSYYETLIEMQFRINKYEDVIVVYDKLKELNMTSLKGNIVEFIAISYLNTNNQLQQGCSIAQALKNANYELSPDVKGICRIL